MQFLIALNSGLLQLLPPATQVDYQALVVLAGPWPQAPSPTLLPGGEGGPSFPLLIIC